MHSDIKTSLLLKTQVFPTIAFFKHALDKKIIIEAHEHYQKRSWRNRYYIGSNQGAVSMSIPLKQGKNKSMPIQEVNISYDHPWHVQHFKTLQSIYGKSPFFIYYKDELESLLNKKHEHLFQFNNETMLWMARSMKFEMDLEFTNQYTTTVDDHIIDGRKSLVLNAIQTKPYQQVFGKTAHFISGLSALDLLFHLGPDSYYYLKSI